MDPIILFLRIILPLTILRFPLVGGLIALSLDGVDWQINFFNTENTHLHYQEIDKILDLYYLSLEAFVVYHWKYQRARRIALSLFAYRLLGVVLFELTHLRILLFIFPNIFESFFLFYLSCKKLLSKEPMLPWKFALSGIGTLTIIKLIQEYPMHVQNLFHWRYIEISFFSQKISFQYDNVFHQFLIIMSLILIFTYIFSKQSYARLHYKRLQEFFS